MCKWTFSRALVITSRMTIIVRKVGSLNPKYLLTFLSYSITIIHIRMKNHYMK